MEIPHKKKQESLKLLFGSSRIWNSPFLSHLWNWLTIFRSIFKYTIFFLNFSLWFTVYFLKIMNFTLLLLPGNIFIIGIFLMIWLFPRGAVKSPPQKFTINCVIAIVITMAVTIKVALTFRIPLICPVGLIKVFLSWPVVAYIEYFLESSTSVICSALFLTSKFSATSTILHSSIKSQCYCFLDCRRVSSGEFCKFLASRTTRYQLERHDLVLNKLHNRTRVLLSLCMARLPHIVTYVPTLRQERLASH